MAQERHRYERRQADQTSCRIEKEPREMGWRSSGGFFEEARVSLKEIDMEEKIEGQRTEVEKSCEEAPVLSSHHQRQHALCVCSMEI